MPTTAELQTLLEFPVEKLTVEYKSWLNPEENTGNATLRHAARLCSLTHSRPPNIVSPHQTHRRTRALYARYASPNFRSR